MASFLPGLNLRDDGYGVTREGRVRLPLEVLRAVRRRVGADYAVGIRYLGDDVVEGGSDLDDAVWFGVRFAGAAKTVSESSSSPTFLLFRSTTSTIGMGFTSSRAARPRSRRSAPGPRP